MALQGKLLNTNSVIYVIVVIWWIVCLWIDEPGTAVTVAEAPVPLAQVAESRRVDESVSLQN